MGNCAGEMTAEDRVMTPLVCRSGHQRSTSPACMIGHDLFMGTAISQYQQNPQLQTYYFLFYFCSYNSQQCNVLLFIMLGLHWLDGGSNVVYKELALNVVSDSQGEHSK